MSRTSMRLAHRIANKAAEEADRRRNVHRGIVIRVAPFVVELVQEDTTLEYGEDLRLTRSVKSLLSGGEIAKQDTVLIMREAGEWTAFDVEERDG